MKAAIPCDKFLVPFRIRPTLAVEIVTGRLVDKNPAEQSFLAQVVVQERSVLKDIEENKEATEATVNEIGGCSTMTKENTGDTSIALSSRPISVKIESLTNEHDRKFPRFNKPICVLDVLTAGKIDQCVDVNHNKILFSCLQKSNRTSIQIRIFGVFSSMDQLYVPLSELLNIFPFEHRIKILQQLKSFPRNQKTRILVPASRKNQFYRVRALTWHGIQKLIGLYKHYVPMQYFHEQIQAAIYHFNSCQHQGLDMLLKLIESRRKNES